MKRTDLWLNQSTILVQPITIPIEALKHNDALAYALGVNYETEHRLGCRSIMVRSGVIQKLY